MSMLNLGPELDPIAAKAEEERRRKLEDQASTILVLSIISICLCTIPGAIATYKAYQAQKSIASGNLDSAESDLSSAKALMIFSLVVGGIAVFGRLASMR